MKKILLLGFVLGSGLIQADPTQNSTPTVTIESSDTKTQLTELETQIRTGFYRHSQNYDQLMETLQANLGHLRAYCESPEAAHPEAQGLLATTQPFFASIEQDVNKFTDAIIHRLEILKTTKPESDSQQDAVPNDKKPTTSIETLLEVVKTQKATLLSLLREIEDAYDTARRLSDETAASNAQAQRDLVWKWGKRAAIGAAAGIVVVALVKQIYARNK